MGRSLVSAPALEPLTVREVTAHLGWDARSVEPTPDAPTAALAGSGAGNVDNGAHRYRCTFVTADGETDGGVISSAVTVADKTADGQVSVTSIPIGGSAVTARKLYRTAAAGSSYLLVATIADNSTTSYTDNLADALLGAGAPASNTTGDPQLRAWILAAREDVERRTKRALITQTWDLFLDAFPCGDVLELPLPPLQAVVAITYVDGSGVTQTLATSVYQVDTSTPLGRVILNYGQAWPLTYAQRNAVTVRFRAGYGDAASAVPEKAKAAMKLLIADLALNREATSPETDRAVDRVLAYLTAPEWIAPDVQEAA